MIAQNERGIFMYNTQEIAKRIKNVIKTKNEPLGTMLSNLEMGVNTVSELGKGKQISYLNFAKIADYLNVSVDYLLGRADEPHTISGNSIKTGDINGNNNSLTDSNNINISKKQTDSISEDFMKIFQNLPFEDKLEVMNFAVKKSKE